MIVRWGLDELEPLLAELSIERPFLVASSRWDDSGLPAAARWTEIPSHRIAVPAGVDGILGAGGGSAIDTAKAASAASGLQLVSVPTTYSGAEWTDYFGVRDPDKRMVGGGSGARLAGIVYEPELTLDLPRPASGGTAMNALAHCVEALYPGDLESARRGAALIVEWLPRVLDGPPRPRGAHTSARRCRSRGRGARDARPIPRPRDGAGDRRRVRAAPRRAERHLPARSDALQRAASRPSRSPSCPVETAEELARLAGFTRLRDLGVPEDDLPALAAATAGPSRRPREPAAGEPGRDRGAAAVRLVGRACCNCTETAVKSTHPEFQRERTSCMDKLAEINHGAKVVSRRGHRPPDLLVLQLAGSRSRRLR